MPSPAAARPWRLPVLAVLLVLWHAGLALDYVNLRFALGLDLPALMAVLPLDPLAARVGFTMAIWLGLAGALFLLFADDAAVLLLFAAGLSALAALVLGGGLAGWLPLAFGDLALSLPMAALALVPALGWLYARALKRRGVLH